MLRHMTPSIVPCPGSTVPKLAREKQARQGRREPQYFFSIGATEDAAWRRFAAARACRIPRTGHSRHRSGWEQRQLGLALAAQEGEIDLDARDSARRGKGSGLRLDALRGEQSTAGAECRVETQPLEVARELLDGLDRRHSLDLDRHPAAVA